MFKKAIFYYLTFLIIFSLSIFFFVKYRKNTLFTPTALDYLINTPSQWTTKYSSPCDSSMIGDPGSGNNWVKINFHCPQGVKNSTLTLFTLKEKSWQNIISEFAKVIGFSPSEVINNPNWECYFDRKLIINNQSKITWKSIAPQRGSIDCVNPALGLKYLRQHYDQN
jgi:hypothetical protein